MKKNSMPYTLFPIPYAFYFLLSTAFSSAQDDIMSMLESETKTGEEKVIAAFKGNRVINAQSCETVKKGTFDFRITHRFSDISSGPHGFWGFDNVSNIRFSFDYGINDRLQFGMGRSKVNEQIDSQVKYRALWQTTGNKVPFSVVLFENIAVTAMKKSLIYSGADSAWVAGNESFLHRFSFVHQLVVARKFNERLSVELLPVFIYGNYVLEEYNPSDSSRISNSIFALGGAVRYKISKRVSVIADYFYPFGRFMQNNPNYFFPLGLGAEIETGGHVFSINFTNSSGIIEQDFISGTTGSWRNMDIKFGFNISRVFTIAKNH